MKKLLTFLMVAVFATNAVALAPNDFFAQVAWNDQADSFLEFVPDPGANAILAWDPTSTLGRSGVGGTGGLRYWTLGSGLSYSSGVLSVTPPTKTFAYPSRSLNNCFQISSTKDADFHYKVDVSTGLSLTSGAQGTVTVTSYTNSGCTTGAQALADGTSGQSGTLVVGLGINQVISVSLDGTAPAGKWLKITTANTVGSPTFAIRAVQAEAY